MLQLPSDLAQQVTTALAEDIGGGDITAQLVPAAQRVTGKVITREEATLCGRPWVTEVFRQLDPAVQLTWHADDGDRVTANQTLFEIAGLARPVLTGERTALNFLQLLSATATATRRYVDAIVGTRCAILGYAKDGPRTTDGAEIRGFVRRRPELPHRALRPGADQGKPHRRSRLPDGRSGSSPPRSRFTQSRVDVEVETMEEFEEALRAGPDIIMLDEFSLADMRAAVALNNSKGHRVTVEASGSVTLETVRSVAETGVDYISIGGITKHVRAVELSMRLAFDQGSP